MTVAGTAAGPSWCLCWGQNQDLSRQIRARTAQDYGKNTAKDLSMLLASKATRVSGPRLALAMQSSFSMNRVQ